jgi:hypothetical protein
MALPAAAMALLSLIPQLHLWLVRGRDWNGAYVSLQGDEPLYSAYVNALLEGRPRKNDPFGGRDDSVAAPLPESIFSIQFIPAYLIALPARVLGVSASTAFIFLGPAAALLSSLSVFWLLTSVTGDRKFAGAGILVVLSLGGLLGSYGIFGTRIDIAYPVLPFLRRYQPAAVFPLFFIFQGLVWRMLTCLNKGRAQVAAVLAGLTLGVLIFSYLYLWTAALAWLVCIGALWLILQPGERSKTVVGLIIICAITALALAPYFYLVAHRASAIDEQQMLINTHWPI